MAKAPTMQNIMMIGIRMERGTRSIMDREP